MKKLIFFSFVYCLNLGCVGPEAVPNLDRDIGAGIAAAIKAGVQNASSSTPSVVITQGGGGAYSLLQGIGIAVGSIVVWQYCTKKWMHGPKDAVRIAEFNQLRTEILARLDQQDLKHQAASAESRLEQQAALAEVRTIANRLEVVAAGQSAELQAALRQTGIIAHAEALRAAVDRLPQDVETAVAGASAESRLEQQAALVEVRTIASRLEVVAARQPAELQSALHQTGIIAHAEALRTAVDRLPQDVETAVAAAMIRSGVGGAIAGFRAEIDANSSRVQELNVNALSTLERLTTLRGVIDTHGARLDAHATRIESTQVVLHGINGVLQGINSSIMHLNKKLGQ